MSCYGQRMSTVRMKHIIRKQILLGVGQKEISRADFTSGMFGKYEKGFTKKCSVCRQQAESQ